MTDTAELIACLEEFLGDAEHFELADGSTIDIAPAGKALDGLKAALAAQAQEIERLTQELNDDLDKLLFEKTKATEAAQLAVAAEARVRELGNIQRNSFLSLKANGEKIAELVLRCDAQAQEIATALKMMDQDKEDYDELEERFAVQAQEIEQAKRDAATERTLRLSLEGERNAAEARVRELELASTGHILRIQSAEDRVRELEAKVHSLARQLLEEKADLAAFRRALLDDT
jgi:chromosome segregation ATPase